MIPDKKTTIVLFNCQLYFKMAHAIKTAKGFQQHNLFTMPKRHMTGSLYDSAG
jgi:hypothetical protein